MAKSALQQLAEDMEKHIGKSDEQQEVKHWVSTGLENLNFALSGKHDGGLGFGRLYELYGDSSSGKTCLATHIMINAQKMGGVAIFIDYEGSFDVGLAKGMGLNTKAPFWYYKMPDTWEQGNTIALKAADLIRNSKAIPESAPIMIVQDSIAAAVPKQVFEKEGSKDKKDGITSSVSELNMNDNTSLSRVTSATLKSVAAYCRRTQATALYLNQIRTKLGITHGDATSTPGGKAMEFYASGRIRVTRSLLFDDSKKDEKLLVGQEITAYIVKSKHTRPFQKAFLSMRFREDGSAYFDTAVILIDYLVKLKKLQMVGAYVTWTDGKKFFKKVLAKKLTDEGKIDELRALIGSDDIEIEIDEDLAAQAAIAATSQEEDV